MGWQGMWDGMLVVGDGGAGSESETVHMTCKHNGTHTMPQPPLTKVDPPTAMLRALATMLHHATMLHTAACRSEAAQNVGSLLGACFPGSWLGSNASRFFHVWARFRHFIAQVQGH